MSENSYSDDFLGVFKCTLDKSKRMANEFESKQKNLIVKFCSICDELNLELVDSDICSNCSS